MAQRKTTSARKEALAEGLRQASRDGSLRPGDMLPTARQLSERYELSMRTVIQELGKLVQEGVLYTVPRVGTFVGPGPQAANDYYLLLASSRSQPGGPAHWVASIRNGFEARIAQLGSSCLVMPLETALETRKQGEMPPLAGVFDFTYRPGAQARWEHEANVPWVEFASGDSTASTEHPPDRIYFDDVDGGRQATEHLLSQGHKRIAFLGLHPARETPDIHIWSLRRQMGWQEAMSKLGQDWTGLNFCPEQEIGRYGDEVATALGVAKAMVHHADISAVVGANDNALIGLFHALRQENIPPSRWPAVVGFDGKLERQEHVLTSIKTPWEEVGHLAAQLLWERHTGRLVGEPVERQIKMTLIPRLNSLKAMTLQFDTSTPLAVPPKSAETLARAATGL